MKNIELEASEDKETQPEFNPKEFKKELRRKVKAPGGTKPFL